MDKGTYVKRLEKMINKYLERDLSDHCPATFRMGALVATVPEETCKMCQEFVGLRYAAKATGCPCNRLRSAEAIARAMISIEKYKEGESNA